MHVAYRRAAHTVWRQTHGGMLVLPVSGDAVLALKGTGEDLWQLLASPLTADEIAHRLAEVYHTSPELISEDVRPMLEELTAKRVIERVEAA